MKGVLESWKVGKLESWLLIVYCLLSTANFSFAQFIITPTITNVTCPGGKNGSVSVSVSGGTAPYTYQWISEANTTQMMTSLSAGNYSVTITDNAAKDSTIEIIVTQPQPISDDPDIQPPVCTANGSIVLKVSGGTSPYNYLWSTGETIAGILHIDEGDYSVNITDVNNCTAGFSYQITDAECAITPEQYFTPNNDGINDTWSIANSQYFPEATLIVFDRWGTRVYEHKGLYEPWNGKSYLGLPVPDAVYYYFFYRDKNEKEKHAKHGSVTIIR